MTQFTGLSTKGITSLALIGGLIVSCGKTPPQEALLELPDDPQLESEADPVSAEVIAKGMEAQLKLWTVPSYSEKEKVEILSYYQNLDPQKLVPRVLLEKAILYFHANRANIPNQKYIAVADFSKHSRKPRFFVVDIFLGAVSDLHVSHGKGSDSNHDGYAQTFSNIPNSEMSSLGYFITAETYQGKHGLSMRLDGLSPTNSKVRERAVVIHSAAYVKDEDVKQGRSWGCFVFSEMSKNFVVSSLKEGSLVYAGRSRVEKSALEVH